MSIHGKAPADLILGIYDGTHDAGAALVRGGRLIAACNEERFTRRKGAAGWPEHSIRACLSTAGVDPRDVQQVALAGLVNPNPGLRMARRAQQAWELDNGVFYSEGNNPTARFTQWMNFDSPFPHMRFDSAAAQSYLPVLRKVIGRRLRQDLGPRAAFVGAGLVGMGLPRRRDRRDRVSFHDHHRCHAAGAYYTCGKRDVLVVVVDGIGDGVALSVWRGTAGKLVQVGVMAYPHSYGLFYATLTGYLGFRPFRHESKLTGLAPHGDADRVKVPFPFTGPAHDRRFTERFGTAMHPWLEQLRPYTREDICAWLQRNLEQELSGLVTAWMQRTGLKDLVVAGGVVANVQLNQKLAQLECVRSLTVFQHMGDGGLAAGAALVAWADERQGAWVPYQMPHAYLGPDYSPERMEKALDGSGLQVKRTQNIEHQVAERLSQGQLVARFAGPMEFGPRALGNRSILAPADRTNTPERLNRALNRSEFMPFAPAVLSELADDWMTGLDPCRHSAAFMTVNVQARPNMEEGCPAAVHIDGSLRPQLVSAERQPGFHRILSHYHGLTGLPAVINTSFNLHEEPIVCTPEDAVRSFALAGLDAMAMGPFMVTTA